jgi:hypothetical protein
MLGTRREANPDTVAPAPPSRLRLSKTELYLIGFILFGFACQLVLLTSAVEGFRTPIRIGAFSSSLAYLAWFRGRAALHPASKGAAWVLAIAALSLLHPLTNGVLVGIAQLAIYLAILGPVFWASKMSLDLRSLRRIFWLFWMFYAASSLFGVLQILFPGNFQPKISSALLRLGDDYVRSLQITLADGNKILRPMGLTDSPGGAGMAGANAFLFGLGFLLLSSKTWLRLLSLATMMLGAICIYMSQIRAAVVMLVICLVGFVSLATLRRGLTHATALVVLLGGVSLGAYAWTTKIGGRTVVERLSTLVADDPLELYYRNRGIFLEDTFGELLGEYPLGAGLGRWGMLRFYFGRDVDVESRPLWAEIQWTGWLYDGGIPLIVAYSMALIAALLYAARLAMAKLREDNVQLWTWAAIVFAYDLGTLALTFSYPVFIGQLGLEFWLINSSLFAVAHRSGALAGQE